MSVSQLPSGKWRALVYDPAQRKNVTVGSVIGGTSTFETEREAGKAERRAAVALEDRANDPVAAAVAAGAVTVAQFRDRWLTDPLFAPPKDSTRVYHRERTKHFAAEFGHLLLDEVDDETVVAWLAGGPTRPGTVPAIRSMLNQARSKKAGRVMKVANPFAGLGLEQSTGNANVDPPSEQVVQALIAAARDLSGPYFAAWLTVAAYSGCRPGELDSLRWTAVDLDRGRLQIDDQWNASTGTFSLPKNGKRREALLTPPAREALLALRALGTTSEFVFLNTRGQHFTSSSRAYHWRSIRSAVGYRDSLYLATRHFAGSYMTNVLGLDSEDVAFALGHTDGGELVRKVYGHKSVALALDRVAAAYGEHAAPAPAPEPEPDPAPETRARPALRLVS